MSICSLVYLRLSAQRDNWVNRVIITCLECYWLWLVIGLEEFEHSLTDNASHTCLTKWDSFCNRCDCSINLKWGSRRRACWSSSEFARWEWRSTISRALNSRIECWMAIEFWIRIRDLLPRDRDGLPSNSKYPSGLIIRWCSNQVKERKLMHLSVSLAGMFGGRLREQWTHMRLFSHWQPDRKMSWTLIRQAGGGHWRFYRSCWAL